MKNLKFREKLLVSFGIVIALTLLIGGLAIWGLDRQSTAAKGYANAAEIDSLAKDLHITVLQMRRNEKDFLMRGEKEYVESNIENQKKAADIIEKIKKSSGGDGISQKIIAISENLNLYGKGFAEVSGIIEQIGDENSGVYGAFRTSAHEMEAVIEEAKQDKLNVSLLMMRRHEKDFLLREDQKYVDQFIAEAKNMKAELGGSGLSSGQVERINASLDKYIAGFSQMVEMKKQSALAMEKFREAVHKIEPLAEEIVTIAEGVQNDELTHMAQIRRQTSIFSAVALIVAIIVGIFFAIYISGQISGSISKVVAVANAIAEKDLRTNIEAHEMDRNDEIGEINRTMSKMIGNLRAVIGSIKSASGSVASAADEISATATQINKSAETQVAAADETGASMEQMSVVIQNVAKNTENLAGNVNETTASIQQLGASSGLVAKNAESMASNVSETSATIEQIVVTLQKTGKNVEQADQLSKQAGNEAKSGGDAVLKTIEGMKRLSTMMDSINGVITNLGERSRAIGGIVKTIEEIADQTNLLALNAAIEAARAGDAGRGFAVVADEVRKLAEKSMTATKEIGGVIALVQKETESAVKATEEGAFASKEGISLSDQAGAAINKIISSVNSTSSLMEEIARATAEQANAAKNVIVAVEEMNKLTQSVTASTREQATGVQQVVKAAEAMSHLTEQVKVATIEQKQGGENVIKAVENINEIARANLAAVSQLSKASTDLAKQSEGLQIMVSEFAV